MEVGLEVLPGARIAVTPGTALDDEIRAAIRREKAAIIACLIGQAAHGDPEPTASSPPSTGPWRLVVERTEPRPGPVRLNPHTTITDPIRSIERDLADLGRAILHRNRGRESCFSELADEYVQRLAACGVVVRVELTQ